MRVAGLVALLGLIACASTPPAPSAPPARIASAKAPSNAKTNPFCEHLERLHEATPAVLQLRSLEEAVRRTRTDAAEVAALAKEHDAFAACEHYRDVDCTGCHLHVFFVRPGRVTVMPRVVDTLVCPPAACGNPATASEVLAVRVEHAPAGAVHPDVGHARILRTDVNDVPATTVATAAPAERGCDELTTHRVEDHFVDLDTGEHLVAFGQPYRTAYYGPRGTVATLPFDDFRVTEGGVDLAAKGCESTLWSELR